MKFLFFTDTHIRGTTPKNRKDNFYETLKRKFEEIKEISEKHSVDYILHGGDWFDRPDLSPSIVREFAVIIKSFNKPIYTIAGNHDIYGHNPETLSRSMLGILDGLDVIHLLKYDDNIILKKDAVSVQLKGRSYTYEIDGENFRKYYIIKKDPSVNFAINIVHGMLLEKPFYEGINYTLIDNIKDTEADITFAGHYHTGFGVKEINSKYFINPGGLTRTSNSITEITRKPSVILVTLNDKINIEKIELKSALLGEEVLDREQLKESYDRNIKIHEFYKSLSMKNNYNKIDINKILEEIVSDNELTNEVKEEALRRIAVAREEFSFSNEEQ